MGPADDGSTRKGFSTLSSDEIHERDEYTVLFGDIAGKSLPPLQVGWNWPFVLPRPDAARGRRGHNENHRRAVEGSHGSGEAVPGVLTDQHRGAAPRRVEGANLETAIDEPLLVEHS